MHLTGVQRDDSRFFIRFLFYLAFHTPHALVMYYTLFILRIYASRRGNSYS